MSKCIYDDAKYNFIKKTREFSAYPLGGIMRHHCGGSFLSEGTPCGTSRLNVPGQLTELALVINYFEVPDIVPYGFSSLH